MTILAGLFGFCLREGCVPGAATCPRFGRASLENSTGLACPDFLAAIFTFAGLAWLNWSASAQHYCALADGACQSNTASAPRESFSVRCAARFRRVVSMFRFLNFPGLFPFTWRAAVAFPVTRTLAPAWRSINALDITFW